MSASTKNPQPSPTAPLRSMFGIPRSWQLGDRLFEVMCRVAGFVVVAIFLALVGVLISQAWLAISTIGLQFFTTKTWDPEPTHRQFGSLAFIYGTVTTSLIAMMIAVPLGVGTAAFLSEIAPAWLRRTGSFLVEMLAAIPSVVYGFWGLFVLAPILQWLIVAVGGPNQGGKGILSAGIILAIMIVPYVAAVSFDVCQAVPNSQREASYALGATRWQTIWSVVLPYARPGIFGGCFLALGRALGETMAVTMLIGNKTQISWLSIFADDDKSIWSKVKTAVADAPFAMGNSIPSVIANEITEADYDLYSSALAELGLVLLLVSVGCNSAARMLLWRMARIGKSSLVAAWFGFSKPKAEPGTAAAPPSVATAADTRVIAGMPLNPEGVIATAGNAAIAGGGPHSSSITEAMSASTRSTVAESDADSFARGPFPADRKRNTLVNILMTGILGSCLAITVGFLLFIFAYLLYRGVGALNWAFFTNIPAPVGELGGGMANALFGSAMLVTLASAFAIPVGILSAIFLAEYRSEIIGPIVRFVGELLAGVPSIVIGVFGYYLIVKPMEHFSGWAGAFALGVMMIPIVMRTTEEALRLVPASLRHASYALGASKWQTIVKITLPAAFPAIITAIFLAIARVVGETAPLILTAFSNSHWPESPNDATPSLPYFIFNYALSPYEDWHRQAWAAALVLITIVMLLSLGVRLITGRRAIATRQAG